MIEEYVIAACSGMKIDVKKGQNIEVIDIEGGQVVDFFAEVGGNKDEFLSTGVTIDCNESLKLKNNDIIYKKDKLLKLFNEDPDLNEILGKKDFKYLITTTLT